MGGLLGRHWRRSWRSPWKPESRMSRALGSGTRRGHQRTGRAALAVGGPQVRQQARGGRGGACWSSCQCCRSRSRSGGLSGPPLVFSEADVVDGGGVALRCAALTVRPKRSAMRRESPWLVCASSRIRSSRRAWAEVPSTLLIHFPVTGVRCPAVAWLMNRCGLPLFRGRPGSPSGRLVPAAREGSSCPRWRAGRR